MRIVFAVILLAACKGGPDPSPEASLESQVLKAAVAVNTTIPNALTAHYRQKRAFPARLDDLIPEQKLKYEQLVDPWNTQYRYEAGSTNFVICSAGPDKRFGSGDDICNGDAE